MAFISLLFYLICNTCKRALCKHAFVFVLQALSWYFYKSWLYTVHPIWAITHLQCTTMGPALGGLENLTRRIKESSPVAW